MIKRINSDKAPGVVGPYSQAVEVNGFVFCSGQIGLDPRSGSLVEGIEGQTRRVIDNLVMVLKAAGCDISQVVKTTIFLKNMDDLSRVNEIYGEYFINKPARETVGVADLPKGALIEISAIAVKS